MYPSVTFQFPARLRWAAPESPTTPSGAAVVKRLRPSYTYTCCHESDCPGSLAPICWLCRLPLLLLVPQSYTRFSSPAGNAATLARHGGFSATALLPTRIAHRLQSGIDCVCSTSWFPSSHLFESAMRRVLNITHGSFASLWFATFCTRPTAS